MFGRGILLLAVLATALILPYYLSHQEPVPGEPNRLAGWWQSMWSESVDDRMAPYPSASPVPNQAPHRAVQGSAAGQPYGSPSQAARSGGVVATPWVPVRQPYAPGTSYTTQPGASPTASMNVAQLVRFDLTPEFVMQNWDRVSTDSWDGDLSGMRIPLVSGTQAHDLAGSLTYYFDKQQTLQRIAFQGTTGDLNLIKTMATQLGLQPQAAYGGMMFARQSDKLTTDLMRVRPLTGSRADSPFQRYNVAFELNRPGNKRAISEPTQQLMQAASSLPALGELK